MTLKVNKFLIRNDDVAFDTDINEIKRFCQICDKYGFKLIQAVIPFGEAKKIKSKKMSNQQIMATSGKIFAENKQVVNYLRDRNDSIAVHGLWHTHKPSHKEIQNAKSILEGLGLKPTYFVPPFNEGNYPAEIAGLKTSKLSEKNGERLEDFLEKGSPTAQMVYLHSWRFDNNWYTFDKLDECLKRLSSVPIKLNLGSKHRKLPGFDNLDKIFGWHFQDGLPRYHDNSVDGVTISHALMFLALDELKAFAKELYRVLKVGGVVRITEDDTENPSGKWYKTGNVLSGPSCLTGPKMMRRALETAGFNVFDVDRQTTRFYDKSLMQAYRGGPPNVFFIEGVKS